MLRLVRSRPTAALVLTASALVLGVAVGLVPARAAVAHAATSTNALAPARAYDAVIAEGADLGPLLGRPIRHLALYAAGAGGLAPIPFQIDEREGTAPADAPWVYTLGPYAHPDGDGGAFDANDELVFMARDAGPRAAERPRGASLTLELEVRDPVSGEVAYAYLAGFDAPQPPSARSYLRLDATADSVSTDNYFVAASTSVPISWSSFNLRDGRGQSTANLLDRYKVRVRALFLLGLVEWKVNEEQLRSIPVGYREGPVRVIRRVKNSVDAGLGLESAEYLLDTVYYDNAILVPAYVAVPYEPGFFMKDIEIRTSVDFGKALEGWTFTSSRNPSPVKIDGVMSPEEKALDLGDTDWIVLAKGEQALISRVIRVDPRLARVQRLLYYVDDATREDRPESERGQTPEVGFVFSNFAGVTAGSYSTLGEIYVVNGYQRGLESRFLELRSKPLAVTATVAP